MSRWSTCLLFVVALWPGDSSSKDDLAFEQICQTLRDGRMDAALGLIDALPSPDLVSKEGIPLITQCVSMNVPSCVERLLRRGVDANRRSHRDGTLPLMFAVWDNLPQMAKLLLEHGADPRLRNSSGRDTLSFLAERPTPELLAVFFTAFPDLKQTPLFTSAAVAKRLATFLLFEAVKTGDVSRAGEALHREADPRATDKSGDHPLHIAATNCSMDLVQLLVKSGADVNQRGIMKYTPLMSAAYHGCLDVARYLVSQRADVNAIYSNSWPEDRGTALMLAAAQGHTAIVKLLLEDGAAVNAVGFEDATALIYSAREGHLGIVEMLLKAGADPNHRDRNGWKAKDHAARNAHPEIVELLSAAQARGRVKRP